jgi:hypothetical protein
MLRFQLPAKRQSTPRKEKTSRTLMVTPLSRSRGSHGRIKPPLPSLPRAAKRKTTAPTRRVSASSRRTAARPHSSATTSLPPPPAAAARSRRMIRSSGSRRGASRHANSVWARARGPAGGWRESSSRWSSRLTSPRCAGWGWGRPWNMSARRRFFRKRTGMRVHAITTHVPARTCTRI